ncbi:acyl-CoA dehydrogenase family protein [Rhodococcus wratislaviensis]|uniref:Putative acyl-CoA dehydrogenase n=1 Tax=Rhodococcus wratislaviensis NBRC 100605 TaxID=1219028 RepID=X0R3S8_RHOWR|nr:acyl-CoA dehydrogenase family protein [Rhodococcus wratislaviensis]GAF45535.1 putative acyl-CoA dehydrogenase [Rhodococcus wratislaviensis NBRC 100605]
MQLDGTPEEDKWREEARAFIERWAPKIRVRGGQRAPEPHEVPLLRAWTAKMFEGGYIGGDWPEQFGGDPGVDRMRATVFFEELHRMGAPAPIGAAYLVPGALLGFGTSEQCKRYLPKIRSGEELWCQLFSEPGAGSDLAALSTRAERTDGGYLLTGQKVWNTNAHVSDFGFLLARTDREAPKHAGITAFLLNMHAPGVTVRPLREITGTADFNEVFLDSVFVSDDQVVGQPGDGWRVAVQSLTHERQANRGLSIRLQARLNDLFDLAQTQHRDGTPLIEFDDVRDALTRTLIDVEIAIALQYLGPSHAIEGIVDAADAPVAKVFSSNLNVRMIDLALSFMATEGVLTELDSDVIGGGSWQDDLLYSRAYTIAGGSNEIMHNIIAERSMGMPREKSPSAAR